MAAELDPDARDRLLDALAANPGNVSAAARAAGYSRMHVYRLLKDARFVELLERRKTEVKQLEEERAKGNDPAKKDERLALEVLRDIAQDGEAKNQDRVAAAKALLSHHGVRMKAVKPGPQAKPGEPAPVVKVLPGDAAKAADDWLRAQG